jgi:hypothetical protein
MGLEGVAAEAVGPAARMTLTSTEPEGFDRVAIAFVARPGGKPLALRLDDGPPRSVPTIAPRPSLRRVEMLLPARSTAHRVELSAPRDAGQQVLGWAVERRGPGIIHENHGSIGATAELLQKLDPAAVSSELPPSTTIVSNGRTGERMAARVDGSVADSLTTGMMIEMAGNRA